MSDSTKPWEFAVTRGRVALIAGCLAGAGFGVGVAGFTAGLLLSPRFSPVLAEAVRQEQTRLASLKPAKPETPLPGVTDLKRPVPEEQKTDEKGSVAVAATPAEPPKPEPAPPAPPQVAMSAPPSAIVPGKAAAETKPPAKPPILLQVQVGSYASEANAESEVDRLRHSGYPAFSFSSKDPNSREWHIVQVGPYNAYDAAAKTVLEIATDYAVSPVIVSARTQPTP